MIKLKELEMRRIFSKISINENGCWIWNGARNMGYGVINFRGVTTKMHRLLYEVFVDKLPPYSGVNVLDHVVCDNPSCCNPEHVKLVKQSYNVLRANSISARNAAKTHCHKGHPFSEKLEKYGKGKLGRRCVICRNINRKIRGD